MTNWAYVCEQIAAQPAENRLSYVHMVEPRFDENLSEEAKLESLGAGKTVVKNSAGYSLAPFSKILKGAGIKFIAAGAFKRENAVAPVDSGELDAVVFGRWFISNPDLPKRLAENPYDRNTFYGADPPSKGYVDYPFAA